MNPWPQEYWVIETNCGMHFVETLPEWLSRATDPEPIFEGDGADPTGGWLDDVSGQRAWVSWGHIAEIRHSTRENRAKITEMSRWAPDGDAPEEGE